MGKRSSGPILPVLTYSSLDEAIRTVESHPHPLALYFFSKDKKAQKKVLDLCHFGGGCINDTIIHLATSAMPFGGVGESGMGDTTAWKASKTFSHTRSIVDREKPGWIFRSGIRSMWDGKKNFCGCFCDSFLIFALPKLKSVKYQRWYVHCHV